MPRKAIAIDHRAACWNPLIGFPRNAKCFCKSGLKFKKCCDGKLHRAVNKKLEPQLKEVLAAAKADPEYFAKKEGHNG